MAKITAKLQAATDKLAEQEGVIGSLGKRLQGVRKWKTNAANQRKAEGVMVVAGAAAAGAATGAGLTYDWMGLKIPLAVVGGAGLMVDDPDIQATSLGAVSGVVYDLTGQVVSRAKAATTAAVKAAEETIKNPPKNS